MSAPNSSLLLLCMLLNLFLYVSQSYCNQDDLAIFNKDEIMREIEESLKCQQIPALVVAVVKDGKILLSHGFGTLGPDNSRPVTNSSVIGIASLTKLFTSIVFVHLLKEKTSLKVDSKVKDLLGDKFQMADQFRTNETTFADLMAHKMSIPDYNLLRYDANFTRENLLDRLKDMISKDTFRVRHYYSNIMYGLVTRLSELIGGMKWEELVTKILLKPLDMKSTTFATMVQWIREDLVAAYGTLDSKLVRIDPEFSRKWGEMAGSGSVMISADDMAKWMNFLLSKGRNSQGHQVVEADVIAEVSKARFLVHTGLCKDMTVSQFPQACSDNLFGFGLRSGHYRGYHRLSHTGTTFGYFSILSLLTEPNIGVFMAHTGEDRDYRYRSAMVMYLTDKALGLHSWLNSSTLCSYPEPWKKLSTKSKREDKNFTLHLKTSNYLGTYYNKLFGFLSVSYNESVSSLTMNYGWGKWLLKPTSAGASQQFMAQGLEINEAHKIEPIVFISDSSEAIIAINATGFLSAIPPIFNKVTHLSDNAVSSQTNISCLLLFILCLFITCFLLR